MRTVHRSQPPPFCIVLYAHPPLYKMLIVDNVDYAQTVVHIVHNVLMWARGQNAPSQSVDTVDTLDGKFKSLNPFCLFFKHMGFSFIHL